MKKTDQVFLLSLTDPYYMHIGAIIVRWATLEHFLQEIIWQGMGLDRIQGRTLTVGMGIKPLIGVLRTLPRHWVTDKSIQNRLKTLCVDISAMHEHRNYLAHGTWTVDPNDPDLVPQLNYVKAAENRIDPGAEPITVEHLVNVSHGINSLLHRAEKLLKDLGGQAPFGSKS